MKYGISWCTRRGETSSVMLTWEGNGSQLYTTFATLEECMKHIKELNEFDRDLNLPGSDGDGCDEDR